MLKRMFFSVVVTIISLATNFAEARCQLNSYYMGLSSPVLTDQIPVDNAIARNSSFRNYTWSLPDDALASDSSISAMNATVDDLSISFRKSGDQIAAHFDLAASLNRKTAASKDQIKVTHIIRDFVISENGGTTGLIYGDALAVELACSLSK